MIGKINLYRIEPCFVANKQAYGEVSRVKKDTNTQTQNVSQVVQAQNDGVDTFTSSKDTEEVKDKQVNKEETKKQD